MNIRSGVGGVNPQTLLSQAKCEPRLEVERNTPRNNGSGRKENPTEEQIHPVLMGNLVLTRGATRPNWTACRLWEMETTPGHTADADYNSSTMFTCYGDR